MKRLLSLDVLRGITIAGMILVNNPGSWGHVYAPLLHAEWFGLTPTDLVFPFFMFIMGVSMYFSLRKYGFTLSRESVIKILRRTIVIFAIGLALNVIYCMGDLSHIRILGVMQRLALVYCFGSLIGLSINHKYLLHTIAGLLIVYWAILGFTDSYEMTADSILFIVDKAVLTENHLCMDFFNPDAIPFDTEGIVSTLSCIAHVLCGFYVGKTITESGRDHEQAMRGIFIFGAIILFAGLLIQYGCPLCKKIWTPSFTLVSCGLASLLLALLIWIIDIKGKKGWTKFFEAFGVNPLYLYVQGSVVQMIFSIAGLTAAGYGVLQPVFGDYGGSLAWAVFFVILNWIPGYFLYKNKKYIKI